MELGDDHIKNLFSSKLSHFEPEVPSSVWDKIEADLPKATTVAFDSNPSSQNRVKKVVLWISGVAAMIAAILFLLPHQEKSSSSNMFTQISMLDIVSLKTNDSSQNLNPRSSLPLLGSNYKVNKVQQSPVIALNQYEIKKDGKIKSELDNKFSNKIFPLKNILGFPTRNIDSKNIPLNENLEINNDIESKIAAFEAEGNRQKDLLAYADHIDKTKENNLQLGLNGGGSVSTASKYKDDFNSIYSSSYISARSAEAKMKHNQPITFGITISKRINKKLSIESGITYTYLSSKLGAEESKKYSQDEMQYFHYLGIPLTLNYTFAQWNKFQFYSSLGAMIQKDFYGRETKRAFLDGLDSEYYSKNKISQKNPQFSTHGGLGASYPIYNNIRLYTNIGAAYYFDANNLYQTIYSEKKWLFNLNIGLRFEF